MEMCENTYNNVVLRIRKGITVVAVLWINDALGEIHFLLSPSLSTPVETGD